MSSSLLAKKPDEDVVGQNKTNSSRLLLRCKYPSGLCTIELASNSTVGELVDKICSATGISREGIKLRHGYPLEQLNLDPQTSSMLPLSSIPICSGENIIADGVIKETTATLPSTTRAAKDVSSLAAPRLVRLVAPSDNCCLFTSVNFCVTNNASDRPMGTPVVTDSVVVHEMRTLIAGIVLSDPINFNEGMLGARPEKYIERIVQPECWGGGIEVSILSALHGLEIGVVDILSGRIDRFGEDKAYEHLILLLYDGIHYDPICMVHPDTGTLQTIFSTSQTSVLIEAQQLAEGVKRSGQFTDLTNCNLMCTICRTPLKGHTGAQQHAKSTGHQAFQEFERN